MAYGSYIQPDLDGVMTYLDILMVLSNDTLADILCSPLNFLRTIMNVSGIFQKRCDLFADLFSPHLSHIHAFSPSRISGFTYESMQSSIEQSGEIMGTDMWHTGSKLND